MPRYYKPYVFKSRLTKLWIVDYRGDGSYQRRPFGFRKWEDAIAWVIEKDKQFLGER